MISLILATVVGVVEVGPGVCQMDLLNPDNTTNTSLVSCEAIISNSEPLHES